MKKPVHLIVGGTLLGFLALGGQRHSIASVRRETEEWKERIEVEREHRSTVEVAGKLSVALPPDPYGIHARLRKRSTISERRQLEGQLKQMSASDLDAALAEIERMDQIDENQRLKLIGVYLHYYISLDPLRAIEAVSHIPVVLSAFPVLFGVGLAKIAETEPARACALLDRLTAEGDSRDKSLMVFNHNRAILEQALIPKLFPHQPDVAKMRLLAMSEREAIQVMQLWISEISRKPDQTPLAKVVALGREVIPEDKMASALGSVAENFSHDLDAASSFLTRAGVNGRELTAAAENVFEKVLARRDAEAPIAEMIEGFRNWVGKLDPSVVQRVTGKSLGNAVGGNNLTFEDASELALHYSRLEGGDDILRAFLSEGGGGYGRRSLDLAEKIRDPQVRGEVVKRILNENE